MTEVRSVQVAVVGAGPYGLATAAHLRHAGVDVRVHGRPMEFWRRQMPRGMILRSSKRATHIADPERRLRIDDWEADRGARASNPLTLEEFTDYALWFQRQAVPDVDERLVRSVERADGGFRLELEDGERFEAERVVVAAGLFPFPRRPWDLDAPGRVSHSIQHVDL